MVGEPGLRERKKARTRLAIRNAAFALFAERGYEATTVADIAEAADIAPRTFFAYFPAKEDVVYADYEQAVARFAEVLAARPAGATAIDGLRTWIAEVAEDPPLDPSEERLVARLAEDEPSLAIRRLALLSRMEHTLTTEVARDLGPGGEPLHAKMVAAAAVAVLAALDRSVNDPAAPPDDEVALRVLGEALAFLDGGLAAWGSGTPAISVAPAPEAAGP